MFDDRLLRVSIELNGQVRTYENLAITCTGSKVASITQNNTQITIANLDKPTRDLLLSEGTPFRRVSRREGEQRPRITIEAGRVSYGYSIVFMGEITTTSISQPPDLILTINALTGHAQKNTIISSQVPVMSTVSEIASQAASALGFGLEFEATDKSISNYSYNGSAEGQLRDINDTANLDVFIDDDVLVVKDRGAARGNVRRFLSQDTGMIGQVESIEFGIKVKFLFDPQTQIGSELEIESIIKPASNGTYSIFRLSFDLANRDTPFYLIAEARPLG